MASFAASTGVTRLILLALGLGAWLAASMVRASPLVLSLDQCADQYVLALSPRKAIVGLSPRARAPDSWLGSRAVGLPIRRADSESVLAAHPQVVVRYWGGDAGLTADLARRGARVITIDDATDFDGVRANVREVARALDAVAAGEDLIRHMDDELARSRGAWSGVGVVYLTSGGATAAGGTLIDSILKAAGMRNLAPGLGYREVSLERLELDPPRAVVAGFFDRASTDRVYWGAGRHDALSRLLKGRPVVFLPGALLGCPAWFAGDAVAALACRSPSRRAGPRCG